MKKKWRQVIFLFFASGESGAGKTECAKQCLQYISAVSGSTLIVSKVQNLNPILEGFGKKNYLGEEQKKREVVGLWLWCCFLFSHFLFSFEKKGNAKTVHNDNSSRFGKYVKVYFTPDYKFCGAFTGHYLLEKMRVVRQTGDERNFHCFYLLTKGVSPDLVFFFVESTCCCSLSLSLSVSSSCWYVYAHVLITVFFNNFISKHNTT